MFSSQDVYVVLAVCPNGDWHVMVKEGVLIIPIGSYRDFATKFRIEGECLGRQGVGLDHGKEVHGL